MVENGHHELENIKEHMIVQLATFRATREKDKTTLYVLYRVVDESDFENILNAKSSKQMRYFG